jgi:hypothetical protein
MGDAAPDGRGLICHSKSHSIKAIAAMARMPGLSTLAFFKKMEGGVMAEAFYGRWLRIIVGVQCLLILAFVLRGWLASDPSGPRLPAVHGETLWLQSHGALHEFDRQGVRRQRLELTRLGLTDAMSSLQFTGEQVFWVHDQGRVHRCELRVLRCVALDLPELSPRGGYRWVRVEGDGNQIVVSDASNHRILVYRRDISSAASLRYALVQNYRQGLRFPNQTLQLGERMWVANTNRHQIAQIGTGEAGQAAPAEFPVAYAGLRPGHRFPFAMQMDERQRLWVLVAAPNMRDADVLLMDSMLRPERVFPLSPDQDPNAVALLGQQLLLPDMTRFTIHRMDLDGRLLEPFGDAPFRAELDSARASYEWARRLPTLLIASIGVLLALGLWLAWKAGELRQLRGKRWQDVGGTEPSAVAAVPAQPLHAMQPEAGAPQVTSVTALAGSTQKRRRVLAVVGAFNCLAVGGLIYWALPLLHQRDCGPDAACDPSGVLAVLLVLLGLLPLCIYALLWRKLRQLESMRIATDGHRIAVRLARKTRKFDARRVTCTRQHLWMGMQAVPLRLNGSPLFDESAFRRDILARLPQLQVRDGAWDFAVLRHFWSNTGWLGKVLVLLYAGALLGLVVRLLVRMLA